MKRFLLTVLSLFYWSLYLHAALFSVKDYGAVGDGIHIDSPSINETILKASQSGGGIVVLPQGTYLCYSIHLQSNITLQLQKGAVIKAAPIDGHGSYDEPEPNAWSQYQDFGHNHWHNSLIWGESLHHITIEGEGRIDGTGVLAREGGANKALALKNCSHVSVRGISILKGGHFAMLLTGVDDLLIEGIDCDTNRDGIDIDCCERVVIRNCRVNTVNDDAIVLKCSYALGRPKPTAHVLIENCEVSGYDVGTLIDGRRTTNSTKAPDGDGPTGRIKLGTESNGGFYHITIRNCRFNHCRGLALESVDGATMKDINVGHLQMNDICNSPIYIRLGNRMRAPEGFPPSKISDISISDVSVSDADSRYACIIAGVEGNPIQHVSISNLRIQYRGGITLDDVREQRGCNPFFIPEARQSHELGESNYPEPSAHGIQPSWGLSISYAENISFKDIQLETVKPDERPWIYQKDTHHISFSNIIINHQPYKSK